MIAPTVAERLKRIEELLDAIVVALTDQLERPAEQR